MAKVSKLFGENPATIYVLNSKVQFDADGVAEVSDMQILGVFAQVPGYKVLKEKEIPAEVVEEVIGNIVNDGAAPVEMVDNMVDNLSNKIIESPSAPPVAVVDKKTTKSATKLTAKKAVKVGESTCNPEL